MDRQLKEAMIDCTEGMLEKIIREDDDAQKLSCLPKFNEYFLGLEQNTEEVTQNYQKKMKELHYEKKDHITYCVQVLDEAQREAEVESIRLIDEFKKYRKHRFRELDKKEDEELYDVYQTDLAEQINMLEDGLMDVEMKLKDVLTKATGNFKENIKNILEVVRKETQEFIKVIGDEVESFYVQLRNYAFAFQEQFETELNQDNPTDFVKESQENEALMEIILDKEQLVQILETSKESVTGKVEEKENEIVKAITTDWRDTETKIEED